MNKLGYVFQTPTIAFEKLFNEILECGITTPNGTRALFAVNILILNPCDNIITTPFRKFSESYAKREWAWYLSGNRSVSEIKKFAPIWDKMHGGDDIVNSNYGYQWNRNKQLTKCIEQLKKDRFTRRAWLTLFDGKEKSEYEFDTPCTLNIGFYVNPILPNDLNMTVTMRSNDLIYGFCNDQYCFSELLKFVAAHVGLNVGSYTHFVNDLHIYDKFLTMKLDYDTKQSLEKSRELINKKINEHLKLQIE